MSESSALAACEQGRHRRGVAEAAEHEDEVAPHEQVVRALGRQALEDPQRLGAELRPFLGREVADRAGQLEGRLPAAVRRPAAHLLEVVAGAAPLEGHGVEDEKDADRGRHHDEREQEEPGEQPAGAAGLFGEVVFRGGRCVLRGLGHRTGRYRFACVIGFGTKMASFSQTVSQSRQDTQGPASTSAILWKVSCSGSSIR